MLNFQNWLPDAKLSLRGDLIAGLTLWALIVPQSIAYANIAGAPTPAAGLYCVMIVLPIYALFASSRYLVASPTTAVSATFAGFLGVMISEPEIAFSSLVFGAALAYFLFSFFKLGFLTNFISAPVSMGYMSGLSIIVIIGQLPKLFGIDGASGNIIDQALGIFKELPNTNIATLSVSAAILLILIGLPKLAQRIPAGLVALLFGMIVSYVFHLEMEQNVAMVGALPSGLPSLQLPIPKIDDLAVIIPASIGLVILASGEASVTAQSMGAKHDQQVDMNQQFFAFGMGNLVGSLFGGMLGTGASSATMVNEKSGARTLMSTIWAAFATLLTVLFLTGAFAYLPNAFLGALVITAVWGMLNFTKIWSIQSHSRGEFYLAVLALVSVLMFGILNGLLISMLINVLYAAYVSAQIRTAEFGVSDSDAKVLLPMTLKEVEPLPKRILAFGLVEGQIYYASAQQAFASALEMMNDNVDAEVVVISVERMSKMDFTTYQMFSGFLKAVRKQGKKLYITGVHNVGLREQIEALGFDPDWVEVSANLDTSKI